MTSSTQTNIKAEPNSSRIFIPQNLWLQTWLGLLERGKGVVESAAVWGGKRAGSIETVEAVYFLDDLVGKVQRRQYHYVPQRSLARLFAKLTENKHLIVADIHTHPSDWVGLSPLDMEHPIEFRRGIHAVVLPSYALHPPSLKQAGVHKYQGDGNWLSLNEDEKQSTIIFT